MVPGALSACHGNRQDSIEIQTAFKYKMHTCLCKHTEKKLKKSHSTRQQVLQGSVTFFFKEK